MSPAVARHGACSQLLRILQCTPGEKRGAGRGIVPGQVLRRVPASIRYMGVRLTLHQEGDDLSMSPQHGMVQRRHAIMVDGVDCRSRSQKKACGVDRTGGVQRGAATAATEIRYRPMAEHQFERGTIRQGCGEFESSKVIAMNVRVDTLAQQGANSLRVMPAANCVKEHPFIELR